MSRRKESDLLWERFQNERKLFDHDLLETLADKPKAELEQFCFDNFNETEAAALLWQSTITKAHRSPADFAEIASGGAWQRTPHLDLLNDVFVDASFNQRFVIVSLAVRSGKELYENTLLPTPSGFRKAGEIKEGDLLFNELGEQVEVIGVFPQEPKEYYKINFSGHDTLEVSGEHNWTVTSQRYRDNIQRNGKYQKKPQKLHWEDDWWRERETPSWKPGTKKSNISPVTITTDEIAASLNEGWGIPQTQPLQLPEKDFALDPYIFGYWLGDGNYSRPEIACGKEDRSHILVEFLKEGYVGNPKGYSNSIYFANKNATGVSLRDKLREIKVLGIKEKFVPHDYLWGSIDQRLALLQGLMDSDGGVEPAAAGRTVNGTVSFTNTNKELADAVHHLAVSLGEAPRRDDRPAIIKLPNGTRKDTGKLAYRVSWTPYRFNPFRLERKRDKLDMHTNKHIGRGHRIIKSVEPIGVHSGICFAVDTPSHLYLAGEGMIPTHNTELISKWAPAWYLCKFPDRKIMQISYAHRVVQTFSQRVRDIIEECSEDFFGLRLGAGSKAKDRFGFEGHTGQAFATGIDGQVIGMGGHLIVLDDAYKDIHQAFSPTYNHKLHYWWSGTLRHRLEPGGSIIVVLARWSPKDLAGWLIEQSKKIEGMEPWIEIKMPMVAEDDNDILGRRPGEVLWPGRYSQVEIDQLKASVGPLTWAAQFQQNPLGMENSMFPIDRWNSVPQEELPRMIHTIRYWDLSAGGKESDFVVGCLMSVDEFGRYYVIDVARDHFEGSDSDVAVQEFVRTVSKQDFARDRSIKFFFEQVPGAGKAVGNNFKRVVFAGLPVEAHQKTGSKEANAFPFASQQQGHNVYIVESRRLNTDSGISESALPPWAEVFIDELYTFPTAHINDDQVDAASGAYQKLEELYHESSNNSARFSRVGAVAKAKLPSNPIDDFLRPETVEEKLERQRKQKQITQSRAARVRAYRATRGADPRDRLATNRRFLNDK